MARKITQIFTTPDYDDPCALADDGTTWRHVLATGMWLSLYGPLPQDAESKTESDLLAALKLLMADVAGYEAWERPCHALDAARAAIARAEVGS